MAGVALGVGVALVLVFALIFSIAFGTKGIADHANALHNADEALRGATVARSQAGLAAHLTGLKTDFGFEATEGIELSVREVRLASQDMRASLDALDAAGTLDATVRSAGDQFIFTVDEVANAIDTGDVATAQQLAGEDLDPAFRTFVNAVVAERNEQASAVAASRALMGRVGDLARFLVAFLVPTAVIVLYRELAKRQQRQSELEVRLETEQELGKARDEFVANASHELRTPLTSIFGLAHLLEEDEKVYESDTAAEMVGMIIGETHDLSRMVDDLLTTARLDAGAMFVVRFPLAKEDASSKAQRRGTTSHPARSRGSGSGARPGARCAPPARPGQPASAGSAATRAGSRIDAVAACRTAPPGSASYWKARQGRAPDRLIAGGA